MNSEQHVSESEILAVPNLYRCNLNFRGEKPIFGHESMTFALCFDGKRKELGFVFPYEKMIQEYDLLDDQGKMYAEGAIDEMFLWSEVQAIANNLSKFSELTFGFNKVELPIISNIMARSWVATGGRVGMCHLPEDEQTPLSFKVHACYDTRFCGCRYCTDKHDRRNFDCNGIHYVSGTKYDYYGYDCDGYNVEGWNRDGIHCETQVLNDIRVKGSEIISGIGDDFPFV